MMPIVIVTTMAPVIAGDDARMGRIARLFESVLQTQSLCTYRTLSKNHRVEKHRSKPKAGE
jgi:hypothetical protein